MKRQIAILTLALGISGATPVWAITPGKAGTAVVAPEAKADVINAVVSSIDVKRGLMTASGRTFRFDPAAVAFSDDRKQPAGGLEDLKPGDKVTLRSAQQNGINRLQQVVVHD